MTTPLQIDSLVKHYGDYLAVDSVSLDVSDGSTLVLLGPSGCGKTTILRCIAGLEKISDGRIVVGGQIASTSKQHLPPERRGVGMVFQSYALWPHMTVLGNVMFACVKQGRLSKSDAKKRASDLLGRFGLDALAGRHPAALSGGQQQRVALARALGGNPRLLLMDEPLSALDPQLRDLLRVELRSTIAETGLACVYVTHDQREALAMADRVAVMNAGRISELGTPTEIYRAPSTAFGASFLGATNAVRGATVVGPTSEGRWLARSDNEELEFTPVSGWRPTGGGQVQVSWRPESTRLSAVIAGTAVNSWKAHVERSVFVGTHYEVLVRTAGGLGVVAMAPEAWAEGADCIASTESKEMTGYAPA